MKIKNIKLPYPVLGIGDDVMPYPSIRVSKTDDKIKYYFDITFEMGNNDIQDLIENEKAQYVCEVDCVGTYFRQSFYSEEPHMIIELPRNQIMGEITFFCSIVAVENITNYKNSQAHPDYLGYSIDLNPGDILAFLGEFKYDAEIKYDKLRNISSFMEITESPNPEDCNTHFILAENKILIQLPQNLFKSYKERVRGPKFSSIIHASLVYNALLYALYNIKEYKDKLWARTLNYRCETEPRLKKYNLTDPSDAPLIANELLGNPYQRLFDNLVSISNSDE